MHRESDYVLGEVLHMGSASRILRGTNRHNGEAVVVKLPLEEPPSPKALEKAPRMKRDPSRTKCSFEAK